MILLQQYIRIVLFIFICTACSATGSKIADETVREQVVAALATVAEPKATQAPSVTPIIVQAASEQGPTLSFATIMQMPTLVLQTGEVVRNRCVETIFAASLVNQGNVTLVGTLRFDAGGNPSYVPTPTDQLHLVELTGAESKFFVKVFEGINMENAQRFLQEAHHVDCSWRSENSDLKVVSARAGNQQEEQIQGWILDNTHRIEAALTYQSIEKSDIGIDLNYESYAVLNGSIHLDSIEVRVKEETEYKLVNTVDQIKQAFALFWTHNNDEYELQEGYWQAAFRDGRQVDEDFWHATGVLVRNGERYGELYMKILPGLAQLVLSLPNETLVLREWK
ncbi:MAG: hypothetical protein R3E79_52785 [Caldilineaceae bacterium]